MRLRRLAVLFAAGLALVLAVPTAAPAVVYKASSYPATSFGEGGTETGEKFVFEAGSVECAKTTYHAELTAASESLEVTPSYTGCKAFGFLSASIHRNGCKLRFRAVAHDSSTGNYTSNLDFICTAPNVFEITASTCAVHIGGQSGLLTIDQTNVLGAYLVKPTVKGLTYNVTKDGIGCPFNGTGHKTGAEWKSSFYVFNGGGIAIST